MPRSANQKLKLLYLMQLLLRRSDEAHPLTAQQMIDELARRGIGAERKSIYDDLEALRVFGLDIVQARGKTTGYYVGARDFELPELKLLVDSVQSSKFITHKKTLSLIKKIESLASAYDAQLLQRQVYVRNRVKSMNESVYYNVDEIVTAINNRQKIIFLYFDYDHDHNRVYRKDGHHYVVSPFATVFDDGHYYLVIYDKRYNKMTNYRIDRMDKVEIIEEQADLPPKELAFDLASYKKSLFGMFSGDTTAVTIRMHRSLIDAVFDLFGEKTKMISCGDDTVRFTADVQVSPLFFGWCCSFGEKLKVLGPEPIIEQLKAYTDTVKSRYEET